MAASGTPGARLQSGPTTLYGQLGSIMRSKIMSGEWPDGFEIPTLHELCEQYQVARVTARQATQMLVAEGLLSAQRGRRTFVIGPGRVGGDAGAPLFPSIGSVRSRVPQYTIEVLEQVPVADLPEGWFEGHPQGPYVRIRKIDREGGVPYAWSETYVAADIFARFPDGAVTREKLARLVRDHAGPPLGTGRERLRVAAADYDEAQRLNYPMSAPIARVQRIFCDTQGRIVYFGTFAYRGDRFAVEHDLSAYVGES
ncbi:GntR family transcriptional regulator [Zavarzinia sp. CC-PAN008]|uniref:GntR family transcriptional regulator n=1 Tax=Zavarzinia sp. CC-PAN008 TaxID=3243332 RepID=UPI003F7442A8